MRPRSKIKQLVLLIPSFLRKMGKRRSTNIIRHTLDLDSSDDDHDSPDTQPRTENLRHVAYSFDDDNHSRRTSYIPVPVSPNKRARISPPPSGMSTPAEGAHEPEEELDMMYLYHRIESLDLEPELDTASRTRTAGVRPSRLACRCLPV